MRAQSFNFEIKDLLTQFVAAFDDVIIKRYDNDRNVKQELEVRYVFAPKQRVMYDIVNKAQNLTLPVVAVNLTNVAYDSARAFNKLNNITNYMNEVDSTEIKMPVPFNLTVSMSILGRYMQDVEQIISNFAPYNNPYIILAWSEPTSTGDIREIRSEVSWDGSISLNTPTETTYSDKFRIVADTTFTIKGWLFKNKNETSSPIYFIKQNFIDVPKNFNLVQPLSTLDYENFFNSLTATSEIETVTLSAIPTITNIFFNNSGSFLPVTSPFTINGALSNLVNPYSFLLLGSNFNHTTSVLLSSNTMSMSGVTSVYSTYTGTASGVSLSTYSILDDSTMALSLPYNSQLSTIDIIINNPAGWTSSNTISGFYLIND